MNRPRPARDGPEVTLSVAERQSRLIALGGVGRDSHSVGLHVLRDALGRSGYRVRFLSTQNSCEDLCRAAEGADAVLVSNMDGHARHYLADLLAARADVGGASALWYLGGNPALDATPESEAVLQDLGFDRVFLGFVSSEAVIEVLDEDLARRRRNAGEAANGVTAAAIVSQPRVEPRARDPLAQRDEVLAQWRTGTQAGDLARTGALLGDRRGLAAVQAEAIAERRLLLQPRCGVAEVGAQRELFRELLAGGADVLSFQVDSLTRNNDHAGVEAALAATPPGQAARLNGFPVVNRGVEALREIVDEFPGVPFQVRHSTHDPRLLAEISFAGGVSAFEGGALCYNLPYYPDYSPDVSVQRWRYVDALAGHFTREHGVIVDREFFGVLTATLVPPSLAIAVCVLEALAAAGHGVRSVSLGYAEQGNRWQDIAAIQCAGEIGRRYLARYGHGDVTVSTVFHQFMGAFPVDPAAARTLIWGSGVTAGLSGATRVMLKTGAEASRIPSARENCEALEVVRSAIGASAAAIIDPIAVAAEAELIRRETTALLDAALSAGREDPEQAMVAAVALGLIDVPFSPSRWNRGEVRCLRDEEGAVRFANAGQIPLPSDLRDFHAERVSLRLARDSKPLEVAVEADVTALIQLRRPVWPLWPGADPLDRRALRRTTAYIRASNGLVR